MFVENSGKNNNLGDGYHAKKKERSSYEDAFYVALIFLGIAGVVILFIWLLNRPEDKYVPVKPPVEVASTTTKQLPLWQGNGEVGSDISTSTRFIRTEDLTFGHFYKKPVLDYEVNLTEYELPINVKTDVSNYYDVSRKMDLDPYIENLNTLGYAIIGKQNEAETRDFFSAYRYLVSKQIPLVISSDFIMYYYQNVLKKVYKEIEKNAFYENVWNIYKKLYDLSLVRYRQGLKNLDGNNDIVSEGARLELAYFAVALKLLEPTINQIDDSASFSDISKFNEQEADNFSLILPDFLKDDVEREVELIRKALGPAKSPVLLYDKDYTYYRVPNDYEGSAKLKNFYLSLKLLNSVFPLYYKSEECPNCLLDEDDWGINMVAANFIAQDISSSQDVKSQWAVIYKFVSFFSGLRDDLTYIHYDDIMTKLFGEGYRVEEIFSKNNENKNENIKNIQSALSQINFLPIEGGLDNTQAEIRPSLGMRILQESYWPNDYIFDNLIGKTLTGSVSFSNMRDFDHKVETACPYGDDNPYYRCRGIIGDIPNLIYAVDDKGGYFDRNTDYVNYDYRLRLLREQIEKFDKNAWNSNIYWLTIDLGHSFFEGKKEDIPIYARSSQWDNERNVNSFLGSWVNMHLSADTLVNYVENKTNSLGAYKECDLNNYIEPNAGLVRDLIARNNMLLDMFDSLMVSQKTNLAAADLRDLNVKLEELLKIIEKELRGESIAMDDCQYIVEFIKHYAVNEFGTRNFTLKFKDTNKTIVHNDGVEFAAVVMAKDGKKSLRLMPIFSISETK